MAPFCATGFFGPAFFAAGFFAIGFLAIVFFAAGFFAGAFFAGIGIVMPGMLLWFICAAAGAATATLAVAASSGRMHFTKVIGCLPDRDGP